MNTKRILGLGFLVALSACKAQCSCNGDDDDGSSGVGGSGGTDVVTVGQTGTGTTTGNGGAGGAGGGEGGTTDTTSVGGGGTGGDAPIVDPTIRFLNVASNAADVNFCIRSSNGDLTLPLIDGGLTSPALTDYAPGFDSPGNYTVVLAPADAEDCTADDLPEYGPFALGDGGVYTLALLGNAEDVDNPLVMARYEDDLTFPAAGSTRLRFIHAAAGAPPVDIAPVLEDGSYGDPFFVNAAYGDDAGYTADVPAFTDGALAALAAGSETRLHEVPGVEGTDGEIVNAIAIGNVFEAEIDVDVFIFNDAP